MTYGRNAALIHLAPSDLAGLTPLQQHMVAELAENINGVCELGQATPAQVAEVLRRLVGVIEALHESNRLASRPA